MFVQWLCVLNTCFDSHRYQCSIIAMEAEVRQLFHNNKKFDACEISTMIKNVKMGHRIYDGGH